MATLNDLTPEQQVSVDALERHGFGIVHMYDDTDNVIVVMSKRRSSYQRNQAEVEHDGSVNGESLEKYLMQHESHTRTRIDALFEKHLNAGDRRHMPSSSFALPSKRHGGKGGYPDEDRSHAVAALGRVKQHGTAAEQTTVRRKVCARYPSLPSCTRGS